MYTVELDLPLESSYTEVAEFATQLGCTASLENLLTDSFEVTYKFQSENYEYLKELTEQVMGCETDEEVIRTIILES